MPGNRFAQGVQAERFANQRIDTARRAFGRFKFFRKRRQHHHRLVGGALFDGRGQLIAFHVRHQVIRENHIKLVGLKERQRFGTASGFLNEITVALKQNMDAPADERFVVHNQDVAWSASA